MIPQRTARNTAPEIRRGRRPSRSTSRVDGMFPKNWTTVAIQANKSAEDDTDAYNFGAKLFRMFIPENCWRNCIKITIITSRNV
mmetsp:Transcript_39045/g.39473  ORF Transcript_39045/g.39473 Transcript_39045/m.39473 type:complete len:84 (+) Transcript_39045:562-813(+)